MTTLNEILNQIRNNSIASISLYGNNIGDSGAKDLSEALKLNTPLISINLGYNTIGASGAKDLSEALKLRTYPKTFAAFSVM